MNYVIIDQNKKINSQKNTIFNSIKNNLPAKKADNNNVAIKYDKSIINNKLESKVYNTYYTSSNNINSITINLTPKAIRTFKYNILQNEFEPGYPEIYKYYFCPQKISTVFQNGSLHWSHTSTFKSQPNKNIISEVAKLAIEANPNCNTPRDPNACSLVDYTGEYYVTWKDGVPTLISSTNNIIELSTFNFYVEENYFDLKLYPKFRSEYLHIKYRLPVRYREAHEDWIFWESFALENILSETEFVKVVRTNT